MIIPLAKLDTVYWELNIQDKYPTSCPRSHISFDRLIPDFLPLDAIENKMLHFKVDAI